MAPAKQNRSPESRSESGDSSVTGLRIGKYQVIRRLHKGRMSHIMLAKTRGIGGVERNVVLKVLRSRFARDRRFINSFLHEERVTGSLAHPQMVQLVDSGESDYGYFMALAHIRGFSLQDVLETALAKRQPIPVSVALSIAHGVASGLHYLHELLRDQEARIRVVHRDVQPGNVMITDTGFVKLIDFGNVTIEGMEREQPSLLMAENPYTPPETISHGCADRRSDIYSLGALLYRMTTGFEPQRARGSARMVEPSTVCSNYIRDLEEIVMRTLHLEPERRLQSAASLQLALEEIAAKYRFTLSHRHVAQFIGGLMDTRAPAQHSVQVQGRQAQRSDDSAPQQVDGGRDDSKTRIRIRAI